MGRLVERGDQVSVLSRRNGGGQNNSQGNPRFFQVDLLAGSAVELAEAVREIVAANGTVSYLVFCQRFRGEHRDWAGEIQVGLTATKILIDQFVPHFSTGQDNAVLLVSSILSTLAGGSQPLEYQVVKAGLNQMMRYFAWQLGPQRIRVNAIMPLTYVKNENRNFYEDNPARLKMFQSLVPLGRIGHVDDSVNAIDFLCSPNASFITGQNIAIDGGASIVSQEDVAQQGIRG